MKPTIAALAALALVFTACEGLRSGCGGSGEVSRGAPGVSPVTPSARLMCVVGEGGAGSSNTGTAAADQHDHEHVRNRALAVPLNEMASRCSKRGVLRLNVSTEPGEGKVRVSMKLEKRFQSAMVRRGIGVALPGALPLEGLASGRYEVQVNIDGTNVRVPAVEVTD